MKKRRLICLFWAVVSTIAMGAIFNKDFTVLPWYEPVMLTYFFYVIYDK